MTQWQTVERDLKRWGLDPHRLTCGCAVKVDLQRVVYPALRSIGPRLEALGLRLAGREDADIFPRSERFSFERRVYPFDADDVAPLDKSQTLRAVTVTAAYRPDDPEVLGQSWLAFYEALLAKGAALHVGKGHTIEAYSKEDAFVHFDLYAPQGAPRPGSWVANNDTIQLIDPSRDVAAPEQTEVALCNALNDLFSLGAVEDVRVYPFYAAPHPELAKHIAHNAADFCQQHGFTFVPQPPISNRTLLVGATVFGASSKQLPTFYDELREGDLILVHRPFGDLDAINVLLERLMLQNGQRHASDWSTQDLQRVVDERLAVLRRPNLDVGRLIQRLCPAVDAAFDERQHLKATGDLSGPGIDIFRELAEIASRDVVIERLPLVHEELARYASEHFLLPNSTSGTNGAIALVGSAQVIEHTKAALETLGHAPQIIGHVGGEGGTLYVPAQTQHFISDWPEVYQTTPRSTP